MSVATTYRKLVPYTIRAKIGALRGAWNAPVHPEQFQQSLARWHATSGKYDLINFPLSPDGVAIDVGAYYGDWCSDIFGKFGCRVIAIEPVADHIAALRDRFRLNPHIEIHPVALGASDRVEQVSVLADGSSTMRSGGHVENIHFVDIAAWVEQNNLKQIDVMQVNCEGGEYELLPRMIETGIIETVDHLVIQFHLVGSSPEENRGKIRLALTHSHELVFEYPFVWEYWKRKS